jgi:autotransporter-associated beta strand protein
MKVPPIQPTLKRKLRLWILPVSLSLGLFSANVSKGAMSNTYTWIGGTNTNAALSTNYTNTVGSMAGFNLAGTTNAYIYPGTNAQTGTQTLNFGGAPTLSAMWLYVTNWPGDVVITNVGEVRIDTALGVTNNSGNANKLWIMATNAYATGGMLGNATFSGNLPVYFTILGGHSTTTRTITQNLASLEISNLTVNNTSSSNLKAGTNTSLIFSGSGNTTVVGSIINGTPLSTAPVTTNPGSLMISSGTLNIATTNLANTNWVSGLVVSNNGSVYILGQLSLGRSAFDVRINTVNATNRTTFGLINTSSITSVALTNNFVIANTAAATNVFKAQSGKTLTLSGRISGSLNGIVVADAGTLVLSGANTALSLPLVVTNGGTLVASNNSALGLSGVTVASGAALHIKASLANSIANSGSVVVADGGDLTSANTLTGSGSLSVGAASGTATFTSSLPSGANNVGPLSLTGNGVLVLNAKSQISSTGALTVSGTGNLITATGAANAGLNNLVVATSIAGATESTIALTGSAVGNPPSPIALGSSFTDNSGNTYTFTKSDTALQVNVTGRGSLDLAFAGVGGTGEWNINTSNEVWNTVPGGSPSAFYNGDSVGFTNSATVTVVNSGVSPGTVSFSNPETSSVNIAGGPITATAVNGNGSGDVNVSSDLTSSGGITISSGNVTLGNTTVNAGGIIVAGGSLNSSGSTTITSGGLTVQGGSLNNSGTTTLSGGELRVTSGNLVVSESGSISAGVVNVTGGSVSGAGLVTGSSYSVDNANYNVALTGNSALTVRGTSTLGNANSGYSGAVTIPSGNVSLTGPGSLGSGALALGGSLDMGGNSVNMSSVNLTANAALNNGTLNVTSASLTYDLLGSGTLSVSNAITVNGPRTNTVSATLSGTAVLNKSSSGRLILTAANSFTGGTTFSSGEIYFGDSSSFGTGSITESGGTNAIRATTNNLNLLNPIVISTNSALNPYTSDTGWKLYLSGPISGPGGIYRSFGDSLYLQNTDSSFGGGIRITGTGTIYALKIGMAGTNSSLGTNATAITTTGTNAGTGTLRWNGYEDETSDKSFILSANPSSGIAPGINILNDGNNAARLTLTLGGNIEARTNTQTLTLGAYNNNNLVLNGQLVETNGAVIRLNVGTSSSGSVTINHPSNNISGGVTITNPTASTVNTLRVSKIGNAGEVSPLGTNGTIGIGPNQSTAICALVYTGTGETNNKNLRFSGTNGVLQLEQAGSGPLKYIGELSATAAGTRTINLIGSTNVAADFASGISDLSGVTSLTKNGTGTWTLSADNSYSGATLISNGTLALDGINSGSGLVTLSTNTSILKLKLTNGLVNGSLAGTSSTAGRGTVDLAQGGDYVMSSLGNSVTAAQNINFTNSSGVLSTLTFTAPTNYLTLSSGGSSGRTIQNSSANLTMIFNAIDIGSSVANNTTFNGDGSFIVNGEIFNTNTAVIRDLVKSGTGTLTLNGANTYNGPTTVSGGTLVAGNSQAIPSSTQVSVASGATLEVRASIPNTVANSGTVRIARGGAMSDTQISGGSLVMGAATGQASLAVSGDYEALNSFGLTGNAVVTMPPTSTISALSVTLAGANNTLTLSGTPGVGLYTLISSTVSWTIAQDFGISAIVSGQTIPLGQSVEIDGNKYTFIERKGEKRLVLDVSPAGAQLLTYSDPVGGGWNTDPTNSTWINGSTGLSASFANGDFATFNGTGSTSVTVSGTVEPGQLTFTIGQGGALNLLGGTIKAGTVMVDGEGSVGVGSALQVDSSMTVKSGTINLDAATTAADVIVMGGILGGSGTLEAGSYQFSGGTVSVSLIGNGSLSLSGNATISGNNSGFSGSVTLTSGSVTLNGSNPLGSGEIALSGGSLLNLGTDGMTLANRVQLGTGGGGASVPNNQSATMSGGITNRSGTNTLIKAGAGALMVAGKVGLGVSGGDATNSYVGLNVTNGVLRLAGASKFIGSTVLNTNSLLLLDEVEVNTWGSTISGAGNVQITNQVQLRNLGGNSTFSNSILVHPNSRLSSSNGFSNATTFTLFANGVNGPSGTLAIGGTNRLTGISSIGNIEIQNGGVLRVINGTISNTTVVNNGKLDFNISSGVTNYIGANGTINGDVFTTVVNGDISGDGVISISSSKDVVLNGNVDGNNSLLVEGTASGSLWLTHSNNFTGGIVFSNGTSTTTSVVTNLTTGVKTTNYTTNIGTGSIHFNSPAALGAGGIVNANGTTKAALYMEATNQTWSITNAVDTGNSSTGVVAFGVGAATNTLNLDSLVSGYGILKITGSTSGELRVRNPLNSYAGGTEVGNGTIHITDSTVLGTGAINFVTVSNSILKIQGSTTVSQTITTTSNNFSAIFHNSDDVSIEGGIYGGNLTKMGQGRLTLKLPRYSGVTMVMDGTLDLDGKTIFGAGITMVSGNLENGTLFSAAPAGIKVSGGTIAANLAGEGGLNFDPIANSVVKLSGSNRFAGLINLGTTNNQTLEVTGAQSLSSIANLSGSSSSANTPTLSLLAGGEYAMNRYSDGNMIFKGTDAATTRLTFASSEVNTISGGNKTLTATNMNVVFQGPVDLAPNQADKTMTLAGNGDFTFRGAIVNSIPATNAGIVIATSGNVLLEATNSYNGATVIQMGTLIVATDGALPTTSAVTVNSGAKLKFNKASGEISVGAMTVAGTLEQNLVTITSSGAVSLAGSTLTVNGRPTDLSYTLLRGSSLTGTPILSPAISGYELSVDSTSVKLVKTVVVIGSTFDTTYPLGSEETVGTNGLKNLMNYALGGTGLSSSPALPMLTVGANGLTLTANIRNDDNSGLNVVGQYAYSLEGPWTDVTLTPTGSTSAVPNTTTKRFTQPVDPDQPRKFLRFKVTK